MVSNKHRIREVGEEHNSAGMAQVDEASKHYFYAMQCIAVENFVHFSKLFFVRYLISNPRGFQQRSSQSSTVLRTVPEIIISQKSKCALASLSATLRTGTLRGCLRLIDHQNALLVNRPSDVLTYLLPVIISAAPSPKLSAAMVFTVYGAKLYTHCTERCLQKESSCKSCSQIVYDCSHE